jgi:hypothetical protein
VHRYRMRRYEKPCALGSEVIHSGPLSPADRLDEVARLLALGFLRLRARRQQGKANEPNQLRRFGLDFPAKGSVGDTDTHGHRDAA